jgi:hypothetical protein
VSPAADTGATIILNQFMDALNQLFPKQISATAALIWL